MPCPCFGRYIDQFTAHTNIAEFAARGDELGEGPVNVTGGEYRGGFATGGWAVVGGCGGGFAAGERGVGIAEEHNGSIRMTTGGHR